MKRLRTRLLFSYVLIIAITLTVIGVALVAFFYAQPLPISETYQRITDLSRGTLVQLSQQHQAGDAQEDTLRVALQQIAAELRSLAEATGLRILIASSDGRQVVFDTLDQLSGGQGPIPNFKLDGRQPLPAEVRGTFAHDEQRWLFVARTLPLLRRLPNATQPNQPDFLLIFAQPEPSRGLSDIFTIFGETLAWPLLQAGCVGMLVAMALAALIARSVARPLQQTAKAAEAVAEGDLDQQVPVTGPAEVRIVARAFNHMTQAVKTSQQTQRDFLANVSHDLRTPLTSIQGFSQAIFDGTAASPEATTRAASIIHDEASRLTRMVQALLDLARLESGQFRMEYASVNPAAILKNAGAQLALRASAKDITLDDQVPDLPNVTGDGDRLAQVFTNLVDNAIKHTPDGGMITLNGELTRGKNDFDGIALNVADTGEGIPQEDLSRIFERFYQVDKSRERRRHKGTGLGLAIAREIVEAHGGRIHAESVVGLGSRFVVWLPLPSSDATTIVHRR